MPSRDETDAAGPEATMAALADPARSRLYRMIRESAEPLGRDELAERTGIARATVAFHLDRLVAVGALTTTFIRRSGRTGPGSGRPAKFYAVADDEVTASVPPRRYDLVGDLLATAADESDRTGTPVRTCLARAAEAKGHELGDGRDPIAATLTGIGYEPAPEPDGGFRLTNCPFHRLASRHTDLICSANTALVRGIADASAEDRDVWLEPTAGQCCVRVGPAAAG